MCKDVQSKVSDTDWRESKYVTSPGMVIRNIILSYEDTPIETYIKDTDLTKSDIYAIIDDKMDIDRNIANELQKAFGVNSDVLLTLANNFRIFNSSKNLIKKILDEK